MLQVLKPTHTHSPRLTLLCCFVYWLFLLPPPQLIFTPIPPFFAFAEILRCFVGCVTKGRGKGGAATQRLT